jgi:hypothetical protein
MDSDEREIFDCLKTWGADFVNAKEVCRRAGGKNAMRKTMTGPNPSFNA